MSIKYKKMLKLLILILLLFQVNGQDINYFCELNCENHTNTACERKDCDISSNCGLNGTAIPFDNAERTALIDLHNTLRNEIASGVDPRFKKATASNMNVLNYDKELEYMAQCWTNACGWLVHEFNDVCRRTSKFKHVGQNIYRFSIYNNPAPFDYMNFTSECINEWYNGIVYVNSTIIDSFRDIKHETEKRHYTQMMWGKTTHFGCGRTQYVVDNVHYLTLVCNYGPGGNILGEPVYLRGKPCSKCDKEQKCNRMFSALCGDVNSLSSDNWVPPTAMMKSKSSKISAYFYQTLSLIYLSYNLLLDKLR